MVKVENTAAKLGLILAVLLLCALSALASSGCVAHSERTATFEVEGESIEVVLDTTSGGWDLVDVGSSFKVTKNNRDAAFGYFIQFEEGSNYIEAFGSEEDARVLGAFGCTCARMFGDGEDIVWVLDIPNVEHACVITVEGDYANLFDGNPQLFKVKAA